ncbi:hypothetical protein KCP78_01915 [Salmonella enterica subsp. enterica]|nr:hypothetical protein KCP78_01915 [Salmonella enterica subsp. enterica]
MVQLSRSRNSSVRVSGDFDKPLWDLFTLNFGVATPAAAVDHLFAGKNGLIVRAPVNGRSLLYTVPFIQPGEEFLFQILQYSKQVAISRSGHSQNPAFELVFRVRDVAVRPRRRRGKKIRHRRARRRPKRPSRDWLQHRFLPVVTLVAQPRRRW